MTGADVELLRGAEPLANVRREAYARLVAAGTPLVQAYVEAGFKQPPKGSGAPVTLAGQPAVADRIAYLRAEREERASRTAIVDSHRIQQELESLALSDVGDVFDLEAESLAILPMRKWPTRARRAVSSVKVRRVFQDEKTQVDIIEFKLWNKDAALRQLREHLGLAGPQGGNTFNNYGVVHMPAMEQPQPAPGERIIEQEVSAAFSFEDDDAPPPRAAALPSLVAARRLIAAANGRPL